MGQIGGGAVSPLWHSRQQDRGQQMSLGSAASCRGAGADAWSGDHGQRVSGSRGAGGEGLRAGR